MTPDVLLAARGLTKNYGRYQALRGIDFSLRRGEILGFLGLNGAGKSTAMQILTGALSADRGEVEVCGHDLRRDGAAAKRQLGYLPQTPPLYDDMLVDEYLEFSARIHGLRAGASATAVSRARQRCGLADLGGRLIRHLSQGYRQRLGLAQALLHEPAVLILDEPTTGLDPAQIRDMRALIRDFGRDRAIVVSTHILPEVRMLASRVVILHEGRIVHDAELDDVANVLKLRFARNPGEQAVKAVPGVVRAEYAAGEFWLIRIEGTTAGEVAAYALDNGWGLSEMVPAYDALEQLFLTVTVGESEVLTA